VLKIFLILLPPILAAMARFEGKVSLSQVDFSIGEAGRLEGGEGAGGWWLRGGVFKGVGEGGWLLRGGVWKGVGEGGRGGGGGG
jgi:hypothetical protein